MICIIRRSLCFIPSGQIRGASVTLIGCPSLQSLVIIFLLFEFPLFLPLLFLLVVLFAFFFALSGVGRGTRAWWFNYGRVFQAERLSSLRLVPVTGKSITRGCSKSMGHTSETNQSCTVNMKHYGARLKRKPW